jgi:hypothetical protein
MSEENNSETPESTIEDQLAEAQEQIERYKAKHDLEKRHRKNAENKNEDFSARLEALEQERQANLDKAKEASLEASRKAGDLEAIEKSHKERYESLKSQLENQLKERDGMISEFTAGQAAQSISSEVFGENAQVMMPHIASRVTTEFNNGKATVRYLNEDGTPSALTKEDIIAEFKNNQAYANFVVGSNASGGGANGSIAKSGSSQQKTITREQYEALPFHKRPNLRKEGIQLTN